MPTRHGLFIRRPRVAAMVLMLVSCVTSATFAQNANKPNHQPPTQANQPETRATYRENLALAAEYETIRMSKPDGSVVLLRVPKQQRWPGPVASPGRRPTTRGPTGRASIPLSISSELVPSLYGVHGVRISLPYTGTRTFDPGTPLGDLLLRHGGRGRVGTAVVAGDDPTEWRTGRGWVPGAEGNDNGDYLSKLNPDFPVLEPGDGWNGPTQDPPPVGNQGDPGWDAKAIARWDVVPYQTITEDFHIGVVAFHINGIDRVEFSVDDGPWVAVREMQLNPRTGVWEYTVILRPELFAEDGLVEVRAVVWPEGAGVPRVLAGDISDSVATGEHSMLLTANANGTTTSLARYVSPSGDDANSGLSAGAPKRTVADAIWSIQLEQGTADGGKVYLLPGQHAISAASWPCSQITNSQRWLTIAAAPGLPKELVHVRGATVDNRLGSIKLLRWQDVTIDAVTGAEVVGSWVNGARVWYDDVQVDGVDRNSANSNGIFGYTSWNGGKYATNSVVRDVQNATNGFALVRSVAVEKILSDAFSGSTLVINSTVTDINQGSSEAHPDILQYHGCEPRNVIIYGLSSDPAYQYPNGVQGLFVGGVPTFKDVAIVDSKFINAPSWSSAFALGGTVHNLYIWNTTFGGPARWGVSTSTRNVVFDNVSWMAGPPPAREGVSYRPTDPH